jgi:predicted membrane metal-binding protein
MGTTLLTTGMVCVIAAIVGGGLTAVGIKFPPLKSLKRQLILAAFGVVLASAGLWISSRSIPRISGLHIAPVVPFPSAAFVAAPNGASAAKSSQRKQQARQVVNVQRYKPADATIPLAGIMDTTVTRRLLPGQCELAVSFTVPPPSADPTLGPFQYHVIMIYGSRRYGPNVSQVERLPESTFAPVQGNWKAGARVSFTVNVPRQYSDPGRGWEVHFCVGSAERCTPSPNLLTGAPLP